jgi:hypothetical protein
LEHYGTEKIADAGDLFREALSFLNDRKDSRWVSGARFLKKETKFYKEMTLETTRLVLQNLSYVPQLNYQIERVLVRLAERWPEAVWDYFGARIVREAADGDDDDERFEAAPFQFHGLEKELCKNPQLAISKGLSWFPQDRKLFRFRGGRLLSIVFPICTPEFAAALAELVKAGRDTEADFALAILLNYSGEISTHVVLKEIVSRFIDDTRKISEVQFVIDSTGGVFGELGHVKAWRATKASLTDWLTDERPVVKAFAEKHILELDFKIALRLLRAEEKREIQKRSYNQGEDVSDEDVGNED